MTSVQEFSWIELGPLRLVVVLLSMRPFISFIYVYKQMNRAGSKNRKPITKIISVSNKAYANFLCRDSEGLIIQRS